MGTTGFLAKAMDEHYRRLDGGEGNIIYNKEKVDKEGNEEAPVRRTGASSYGCRISRHGAPQAQIVKAAFHRRCCLPKAAALYNLASGRAQKASTGETPTNSLFPSSLSTTARIVESLQE